MQNKGIIGELKFSEESIKRGYFISKPILDTSYDLILDSGRLFKVQIKTVSSIDKKYNRFTVTCRQGKINRHPYSDKEVDIIAIYIQPKNIWYIIPSKLLSEITGLSISNDPNKDSWKEFKDNWSCFGNK